MKKSTQEIAREAVAKYREQGPQTRGRNVTIYAQPDDLETLLQIQTIAQARGVSYSSLLFQAAREYLNRRKPRKDGAK